MTARCDQCGDDVDLAEDREAFDEYTQRITCESCRKYNMKRNPREDQDN